MVHIRIVIPPGQSRSKVVASVVLLPVEANELRDALEAMLAQGESSCHVEAVWGENRTDITLGLALLTPGDGRTAS